MNPIPTNHELNKEKETNTALPKRKKQKGEAKVPLPLGYSPSPHTVIVGRGKEPTENLGNKRLRVLARSYLPRYQKEEKRTKTKIVSEIINIVKKACPNGGAFVKHGKDGRWYEVGPSAVREKVGYVFRDLLADQYKSSSKSKVARRRNDSSATSSDDEDRDVVSSSCHSKNEEEDEDDSSRIVNNNGKVSSTKLSTLMLHSGGEGNCSPPLHRTSNPTDLKPPPTFPAESIGKPRSKSSKNTKLEKEQRNQTRFPSDTVGDEIPRPVALSAGERQSSPAIVFDHFCRGDNTGISIFQSYLQEQHDNLNVMLFHDEGFDYELLLKCPMILEWDDSL